MKLAEREIRIWTFVALGGFFIVLIFSAMSWRENRVLNKIIVKGNEVIPDKKIIELANVKPGVKLTDIDLSRVRANIEKHGFIKYAEVYINLPDVLFIEVVEREPVAMLTYQGKIYYIDSDGVVISFDEVNKIFAVPLLSGVNYKPLYVNLDTVGQLRKQFELIKASIDKKIYGLISEVKFKDGEFILLTSDSAVTVFLSDDEFERKLALLREFWTQIIPTRGYPSYIDLRYHGKLYAKFSQKINE